MDIIELLLCYWVASFMLIFFLYVDAEKLSIKNFISTLLVSALCGWILVPTKAVVELVRIIKKLNN